MDHIAQHFRMEERLLVERTAEWARLAGQRHQPRLTSFLDPREQVIVRSVVAYHPDVKITLWGGWEEAERRRGLIVPEYLYPEPDEYQLALLEVKTKSDEKLTHRDLLGAVLSLGIKREMIGDISISSAGNQLIVAQEMADYLLLHLTRVGKEHVEVRSLDWSRFSPPQEVWQERTVTVSSLRLDAVVASCVRASRSKALNLIKAGHVKVNWKTEDSPAEALQEGDTLSIKGYGRFLMMELLGETRKQNIRLRLGHKR